MQLNYAYRFLAQNGSDLPSTPWEQIQLFVEESEILQKVLKRGYCINLKEVQNGVFVERYELAQ